MSKEKNDKQPAHEVILSYLDDTLQDIIRDGQGAYWKEMKVREYFFRDLTRILESIIIPEKDVRKIIAKLKKFRKEIPAHMENQIELINELIGELG